MALSFLLSFIAMPAAAGVLMLLLPKPWRMAQNLLLLAALLFNLQYALLVSAGGDASFSVPWGGFGFNFGLRVYAFGGYILLAAALLSLLVSVFTCAFTGGRAAPKIFYGYLLLTVGFVNGALLADDLLTLLFFWEGLLVLLYGMIYVGHAGAFRTAAKALIICGAGDLCMMAGLALTAMLAHTTQMSRISLPLDSTPAELGYLFFTIGALAKGGAMPFHSWIPDAADDAPLPFMALVPGALEKLLGIYLLCRVTLDFYQMQHGSWVSELLMIVGALTIVLAVLMALVQKNYKRLLSFHAVSQVGYMVLGIGTGTPAGVVGGVFHMINNALYKCGLFLTAGAVEKQAGTDDLKQLGGLGRKMPVTCLCFAVLALSISGVPFFNGFFSKELVYEGALERGWWFYAAAVIGSMLTAASFLKLGHAAYFDRARSNISRVKEASWGMLLPILIIAALCLFFGFFNAVPLGLIEESLGSRLFVGHHFSGPPKLNLLTALTLVVLAAAVINHLWGVKKSGSGLGAVDHVHCAPGLHWLYEHAEMRYFDPYEIAMRIVRLIASAAWGIDRGIDWFYNVAVVRIAAAAGSELRREHNGSYVRYMIWSLAGALLAAVLIV